LKPICIVEADLGKQVADDTPHGCIIIDHKDLHGVLQNTSVDEGCADAIRSVAATQPIHQQHPDYRRSGKLPSVQEKALAAPDPTASVECSAPTMRVERKYCVYAQHTMPTRPMRT
jgi:hypothetical protein